MLEESQETRANVSDTIVSSVAVQETRASVSDTFVSSVVQEPNEEKAEVDEVQAPPTFSGHLLKESPNKLRQCGCSQQLRFIRLDNGQLYWAKPQYSAHPNAHGMPSFCRGTLDLLVNPSEVRVDRRHRFTLQPAGGQWKHGTFTGVDTGRIFYFDAEVSEHSQQRWMEAFKAHIMFARNRGLQARAMEILQEESGAESSQDDNVPQ
mmetsp:Transcript_3495/g.8130  ORF Transcript_3495/g.8130 Transcript_3495/m.8130 type:complete len:207 (+) Transcript_3495:89-709(+)